MQRWRKRWDARARTTGSCVPARTADWAATGALLGYPIAKNSFRDMFKGLPRTLLSRHAESSITSHYCPCPRSSDERSAPSCNI